MKIKRIYANNCFKFYENHVLDATFGDVTEVCGINEAGKSTIKKIIQWILNCRDENGKEITGIRPHDKNGNDVNSDDCTAFIELEIDGTVKQLKKVYRQNVNKKGEVTGNVTECYINDILKKAGDYKEFLEENFENLSYCINAMTLLSKNASDQREILNNVFSTHTDSDICDMDSSFEELRPMLEDGSVKELKDRCNRVLNGSKGKNATKGLKQQAAEYQSRIDELNLQKVNIDVAELELHRSGLKKELDEVIERQKDSSSTVKEHDGFLDEIMKLKFEISEIQNSANDELQKQKRELMNQKSKVELERFEIANGIENCKTELLKCREEIEKQNSERERLAGQWKSVKEECFDESTTICPTCHRELPGEEIQKLKDNFASEKSARLSNIEKSGSEIKKEIERLQGRIDNTKNMISSNEDSLVETDRKLKGIELEIFQLPSVADISSDEKYKELSAQISKLEDSLKNVSVSEINSELKERELDIRQELSSVEIKISKAEGDVLIDERIEELTKEWRDCEQKIADQERIKELLKDFERRKNEILTADVNKYLDFCKVKMFRPLVNGEIEECCDFIKDGESYSRNLNHGARMLTEMDICMAFQKKLGISIPIIIDDAESVDNWRIPKVESQLILLKHTQDKELVIEAV
jgi:chromosome segregation ATPase